MCRVKLQGSSKSDGEREREEEGYFNKSTNRPLKDVV